MGATNFYWERVPQLLLTTGATNSYWQRVPQTLIDNGCHKLMWWKCLLLIDIQNDALIYKDLKTQIQRPSCWSTFKTIHSYTKNYYSCTKTLFNLHSQRCTHIPIQIPTKEISCGTPADGGGGRRVTSQAQNISVGLAKTVYIRIYTPYTWWFLSQKYRMYTVYIWFWPSLYICNAAWQMMSTRATQTRYKQPTHKPFHT